MFKSQKVKAIFSFSIILVAICSFTMLQGFSNSGNEETSVTIKGKGNSGCLVTIIANRTYILREKSPGVYVTNELNVQEGIMYTVTACNTTIQMNAVIHTEFIKRDGGGSGCELQLENGICNEQ